MNPSRVFTTRFKKFFFIEERILMAKYSIFCIAFLVSISYSEDYYHRGSASNQISMVTK
jgi:hypothetical protein